MADIVRSKRLGQIQDGQLIVRPHWYNPLQQANEFTSNHTEFLKRARQWTHRHATVSNTERRKRWIKKQEEESPHSHSYTCEAINDDRDVLTFFPLLSSLQNRRKRTHLVVSFFFVSFLDHEVGLLLFGASSAFNCCMHLLFASMRLETDPILDGAAEQTNCTHEETTKDEQNNDEEQKSIDLTAGKKSATTEGKGGERMLVAVSDAEERPKSADSYSPTHDAPQPKKRKFGRRSTLTERKRHHAN